MQLHKHQLNNSLPLTSQCSGMPLNPLSRRCGFNVNIVFLCPHFSAWIYTLMWFRNGSKCKHNVDTTPQKVAFKWSLSSRTLPGSPSAIWLWAVCFARWLQRRNIKYRHLTPHGSKGPWQNCHTDMCVYAYIGLKLYIFSYLCSFFYCIIICI